MSESDPYSNKKKSVESAARDMGEQDDTHMNPDLPDTSDEDVSSVQSGRNQAQDEDEDEEE